MEKLKLFVDEAESKDFAELDATNLKEVYLRWAEGPSAEEILPVLKKCRYLQRLTLLELPVPALKILFDFIMGMKHLTYLELWLICNTSSCEQLKSLRDKINKLVLPQCPNFELVLECDIRD